MEVYSSRLDIAALQNKTEALLPTKEIFRRLPDLHPFKPCRPSGATGLGAQERSERSYLTRNTAAIEKSQNASDWLLPIRCLA